tara:strand:+ start:89 stop:430 length:342 start_codon:yes stop_codon:yes gene_type:complete
MTDNIFHINKKLKIENNINNKNDKIIKNKKINLNTLIQYQQINFYNNKYLKKIQNKYTDKYNELKSKNNSEYCIEDHTFKYYPFVNNGTCRFCLKKKPKSEKELLDESYKEIF